MRSSAMLDLVITNKGNVMLKGSLGCSDHEIVECKILGTVRRVHSKITALDFRQQTWVSSAFDTVVHDILIFKAERQEFDGWTTQWIRNWLDGHIQSVVVNDSMSKWRPVLTGVPQGLVLALALFNNFVSKKDSRMECTIRKFADDTKLCDVVNTLEGSDNIQRDLHRLKRWDDANLTKSNKAKCQVLHLGQANSKHNGRLGREWIESSPEEQYLEVLMDKKPSMSWQYALTAQKAKSVLG
ncbi:rna-directed dna polymerase from mobile element jockey-like [Pitangus sulphuratus]|nr:rna-directed dna polymerase from mobile element jockey-like [Pitangus sulphuratus]